MPNNYAQILTQYALPNPAQEGDAVEVSVTTRNNYPEAISIKVVIMVLIPGYGEPFEITYESAYPSENTIDSGWQMLTKGKFYMPGEPVNIYVYSYFWSGSQWMIDNEKYDLVVNLSSANEWLDTGVSISMWVSYKETVAVWLDTGVSISMWVAYKEAVVDNNWYSVLSIPVVISLSYGEAAVSGWIDTGVTKETSVTYGDAPVSGWIDVNIQKVLSVTISGGTATVPKITAFTPKSGKSGTSITITGSNFTGATSVSIAGVLAKSFTVVSSTQIKAVAGDIKESGKVMVTTSQGIGISADSFTYEGGGTNWIPWAIGGGVAAAGVVTAVALSGKKKPETAKKK